MVQPITQNVYTVTHYSQRCWDTWSAELAVVKQPTFNIIADYWPAELVARGQLWCSLLEPGLQRARRPRKASA